jgi:GTPase
MVERRYRSRMGWAAGVAAAPGLTESEERRERADADEYGDGTERAILVGADLRHPGVRGRTEQAVRRRLAGATLSADDSIEELEELARTAGAEVAGRLMQKLDHPDPATFIGKGKVEELRDLIAAEGADLVIFDEELTPSQQRNLENALKIKIVDRTSLILDIFAQRARTREGQLQVELAQLEYLLPRLSQLWVQFSRLGGAGSGGGGGGGRIATRGPGETQLEVDRRAIRRKVADLRLKIEKISEQRGHYRSRRKEDALPIVALVGYTNAGKSTLLRALSDADVFIEDKLFATLDPTTRRVRLPNGQDFLLTDTVGFIQRLPTALVAAFKATLEEINDADVLIHVVDATHPNRHEQIQAVGLTLDELEIGEKPVVTALNKIDKLTPEEVEALAAQDYPSPVPIAAAQGIGMDRLLATLQEVLEGRADSVQLEVRVPYAAGELVRLFHQRGVVEHEEYGPEGTELRGTLPRRYAAQFERYAVPQTAAAAAR